MLFLPLLNKNMIFRIYNNLVEKLSFSPDLQKLRRAINMSIDVPEFIENFPDSHPRGFVKEFRKRRTTIAEAYLRITKTLESAKYDERIHALSLLAEHIIYSKSIKMPLNTARVQLALMKEVVRNRNNKRVQLELLRDFTISTFGHPRSVRKYLKKLDLIEVPETGKPLSELNIGWDFHVHDKSSYGRKSPVQLIIDAFIKGVSELTVAYNNLDKSYYIREVVEAGRILGIKVNIALEFSAELQGKRFHFMYILPYFSGKKKKLKKVLKLKSNDFEAFMNELQQNEKKRRKNILYLVEYFNKEHLPAINKGYEAGSIYYLEPLSVISQIDPNKLLIHSRRHLGELLFPKLKEVLINRLLLAMAQKKNFDNFSSEHTAIERTEATKRYVDLYKAYTGLSAERLRLQYFNRTENLISESEVSSLPEISKLAQQTNGIIKFISPLENGLEAAIDTVLENVEHFTHVEIFNMFDSVMHEGTEFVTFTKFIQLINKADYNELVNFYKANQLNSEETRLNATQKAISQRKLPFISTIGSDATGWSTLVPGMGFVFEHNIPKHQRNWFKKRHLSLAPEISEAIATEGDHPVKRTKKLKSFNILSLGKTDDSGNNFLGDELPVKPISPLRALEYTNPQVVNIILILIGFLPAYFTVGVEYAMLWFAITGFRNIFVDLISAQGIMPGGWSTKDINQTNLANSLFWTGFSVPILGFVKDNFETIYPWVHEGASYEYAKFFFINIANGTYLATHNYIRGFDKATIRANFFRSLLAWPLSASFSGVGNAFAIPSIVQAKFWSDFIASIIEGTAKLRTIVKLESKLIDSLLPEFDNKDKETEILAILDLMYITENSARAKSAMLTKLYGKTTVLGKLKIFVLRRPKPKPEQIDRLKVIQGMFTCSECYFKISNYIISHYNKDQSIFLLNMLARNFQKIKVLLENHQ